MAGALPLSCLHFKVHRHEPELITPAKPTPYELKPLSDIDDQEGLRFQIPIIQIYENTPTIEGKKDPVKVIREALAKALVYYYPFAGRIREGLNRKLMVECNGEGILFLEADADVKLEEFGDALYPPFPCFEDLLFDVPGSSGIINCPLLLIQVTRLKCGGFILALRLNHTMSDTLGIVQFLSMVAEMTRGVTVPSISPVWERNILNANDPPLVTHKHDEYEELGENYTPLGNNMSFHRSFFFDLAKMSALRKELPPHLRSCSIFDLVTACLWKCYTIALQIPNQTVEMRMMCAVSARNNFFNSAIIPKGYYGNAFVFPAAMSTVGELLRNPISYALELVIRAKACATEEYLQSVATLMSVKGRPYYTRVRSFLANDTRHVGLHEVDFGWGKPLYGGVAKGGGGPGFDGASFYVPFSNKKGEKGIVVPIILPKPAMEIFEKELDKLVNGNNFIRSSM